MSKELMQQAVEKLEFFGHMKSISKDTQELITTLRERLAQPEKKTCLVSNESCKHGSWCSEVYCQEHCKFVEQSAQPEQEPVAWRWKERINGDFDNWVVTFSEPPPYAVEQQPLYTEPPKTEQEQVECMCGICKLGKREWVGLTLREVEKCIYDANDDPVVACRNIEAKLKEKNT